MCKRNSWPEQPLEPISQKLSLIGSPTKGTHGKFDLSTKIQTWSMDEQALSSFKSLEERPMHYNFGLRIQGAKFDLFFLASFHSLISMKTLKTKTRGELYISMAHEVTSTFGFPFIGKISTTHLFISNKFPSFPLSELPT